MWLERDPLIFTGTETTWCIFPNAKFSSEDGHSTQILDPELAFPIKRKTSLPPHQCPCKTQTQYYQDIASEEQIFWKYIWKHKLNDWPMNHLLYISQVFSLYGILCTASARHYNHGIYNNMCLYFCQWLCIWTCLRTLLSSMFYSSSWKSEQIFIFLTQLHTTYAWHLQNSVLVLERCKW